MAQPDQPNQGQTSHTDPYVDIPSDVEEEMHESSATNQPPPAYSQAPIGQKYQMVHGSPLMIFHLPNGMTALMRYLPGLISKCYGLEQPVNQSLENLLLVLRVL